MEDNKYISKEYLKTYVKTKGFDEERSTQLVKSLVADGYTIEGLNDQKKTGFLGKVEKFGKTVLGEVVQPFESFAKTTGSLGSAAISSGVNALGGNIGGGSKSFQEEYQRARDINNQVFSPTRLVSGGEVEAPARDITTLKGIEQTVGDVGEGALNLATLGAGGSAIKTGVKTGVKELAKNVSKTGYKEAIKQGAKYGAGYGATNAMQEGGDVVDIAKQGATGGLIGAGLGVAGQGLSNMITSSGKLSSQIKTSKLNKKEEFALDLVSPKQTEAVKLKALKEGRVTPQGLLSASKIAPSKRDKDLANVVKDIVSTKSSPYENLTLISKRVDEINSGVKAYIKSAKVPFNTAQLKTQLNKGKSELKLVFASDQNAEKTYNALVKEFMKHVKSKDTYGLFEARQAFDKLPAVKKLLDSSALGENVKKETALTLRKRANEYIASLLPKGNTYREALLDEHKMIEAIQNIAEKNVKSIGKNRLQSLTEQYPILKAVAGGLAGGLGLGAAGVGASVIGSSD